MNSSHSLTLLFYVLLFTCLFAEEPRVAIEKINSNEIHFQNAARTFDIDVNILKAIVYTERVLNVDWKDEYLENAVAKSGYNVSIGLCQIKVTTGMWIEKQLIDSTSQFHPNNDYSLAITKSGTREKVISKLLNIPTNIIYAAAYLRIFIDYFRKYDIDIASNPAILGTLYSSGISDKKGGTITPVPKFKINKFGKYAKQIYLESKL